MILADRARSARGQLVAENMGKCWKNDKNAWSRVNYIVKVDFLMNAEKMAANAAARRMRSAQYHKYDAWGYMRSLVGWLF